MAGSRRRPFRTRGSWIQRVRRSTHRGAKLASSSSDGSPERKFKVLVVGANAGGGADGSPVCVPVFGSGDEIPRSVIKIGEGDVPKVCDGIGEGGPSSVPVPKMCDGIGDAGASSVPIPKMCDGGRRLKEPVKLDAGGGDRSPERILNIGRSRLRVDHLDQLYVLDSEDEGIGMEAGLYVPDSEEEDGHGRGFERPQLRRRAGLPGGDVGGRYNHGCAVVASTTSKMAEKMTMVANPVVQAASIQAVVDVPVGASAVADELHPEMVQHLKELLYWTWYYMQCGHWISYVIISNKKMERLFIMRRLHIKVSYGFSSPI
nr:uncharacterized protein LOC117850645 [Setaria viridis]